MTNQSQPNALSFEEKLEDMRAKYDPKYKYLLAKDDINFLIGIVDALRKENASLNWALKLIALPETKVMSAKNGVGDSKLVIANSEHEPIIILLKD